MPEQAVKERYTMNGGAAYAYETAAPEQEFQQDPTTVEIRRALEQQKIDEHEAAIQRAREKTAIAPASVLGFALAAIFIVMVIMSYVRLTVVVSEISALNAEIATLQSEAKVLSARYERTFNLNEVKEYATDYLGMKQMTEADVTRFSMARSDKGVVLAEDDASGLGIVSGAREFVSSLMAYFSN